MLLLPLEEDSPLLRACMLYGAAVLALEVVMPLLFQRRVRIVVPELHLPQVQVLTATAFRRQTQLLKDEIRSLQRAPRTPKVRDWPPIHDIDLGEMSLNSFMTFCRVRNAQRELGSCEMKPPLEQQLLR